MSKFHLYLLKKNISIIMIMAMIIGNVYDKISTSIYFSPFILSGTHGNGLSIFAPQ